MFILSRHILRQHIGPFLFGFFIITLMFMLNLVFKELGHILSKGLPFGIIVEFFALNLAWIIALAVPMSVLMACLMAFGQLSADNEITAIKASGISLFRIILPILISSAMLSLFLIWFNNEVLPDANHRLRLLARDITIKKPTVNLEPGYLYHEIPNLSIRVDHIKEQENLSNVTGVFIQDRSDPNVSKTIVAERGEIFVNKTTGLLQITLYDGEIHEINFGNLQSYNRILFPRHLITIPIPNMVLQRSESSYRGDREQSSHMMRQEINKNLKIVQTQQQHLNTFITSHIYRYFPQSSTAILRDSVKSSVTTDSALVPESLKFSPLVTGNLTKQVRINRNIYQRIKGDQEIRHGYELTNNKLRVEIYKKYSIPFACMVFVLIGAPLGIMARKGNLAVGGGISLVFFVIYWVFLIGGEELADRDLISPFLSMWLANLIVGIFGIYLLLRTIKESSFINFDYLLSFLPKSIRKSTL